MAARLIFRPVTKASWADFEALFEAPGGPKYCWCMAWRASPAEIRASEGQSRKPLLEARVVNGTTIGLIGYLDDQPVAWVSVAPRDTYRELGGPEAVEGDQVWSLACMYVRRKLRGMGLGHELIAAAATFAREHGATVLEAYPVDPASPSYRFMGFVPAFEAAGFTELGLAGSRRHVMRLTLS
jgi:GNAT superfamily N-acetyltransferase